MMYMPNNFGILILGGCGCDYIRHLYNRLIFNVIMIRNKAWLLTYWVKLSIFLYNKTLSSLSLEAQIDESFFMRERKFQKPALTTDQQIDLLKKRGLIINDEAVVEHYLQYIGYYRLMGYGRHFMTVTSGVQQFQSGTTFESVLDLYIFDRELRLALLDAIERIEIGIRVVTSNYLSCKYSPHWFLDKNIFKSSFKYEQFIKTIEKETGVHNKQKGGVSQIFRSYYSNYDDPPLPPSWMLTEGLSLGAWSQIFAFLATTIDQKEIARKFRLSVPVLKSWLHALTYLRNLCAHHSIICFRHFHISPTKPHNFPETFKENFQNENILYPFLIVTHYLNLIVSPESTWGGHLVQLVKKHPVAPLEKMGFIKSWETRFK